MQGLNFQKRFPACLLALMMPALWPVAAPAAESPGVAVELAYAVEGVRNFGGGLSKGAQTLGTGMLDISVDTGEAGWWPGGTLFLEGLLDHGRDPSARLVGDTQAFSNIADKNRTNLHQFWYEQKLGRHASALVGLHDLNSVFDVSDYASLFLNSSFGITPEISVNVPTSIWPRAGYAAVAQVHLGHASLRVGVYDGDPATRAVRSASEGLMWIAELGWEDGAQAFKLGAWRHTADKTGPGGKVFRSDSGVYGVLDQPLFRQGESALGVFVQIGFAQRARNDISNYLGLGLYLDGPLPGRGGDSFGIAMARAGFSPEARRVNGWTAAETALEATYDLALTDWLHLHPSFQYILHPGGDPALAAAKVGMLRIEASLP